MTTSKAFLDELQRDILAHPAVNHLFLNRLATSPFAKGDYRVFAENHFQLVRHFTGYLEQLLCRAPDSESKLWLAKVLVDEYGEGSEGKDHAALYAKFLRASGGNPVIAAERKPLPAQRFIAAHSAIVRFRPFLEGLGAIGPGHEWAIPKMFDSVIPGLLRAGFTEEEIHYFTLHVRQDEDHASWLYEALLRLATTPTAQAQIRRGAMFSLDERYVFWTGVQSAVIRWRQPKAVRQDGPYIRSGLVEAALTFWDSLPWAVRMEERMVNFSGRLSPVKARLAAVVARNGG